MSMIQTHSHCYNDVFVINWGLIWLNLDNLLLSHAFGYNLNYFDASGFISTHGIEFDQMSMIQTHSHCYNDVFVINWSLIWPNLDYLLLSHVFEYSLNYFNANGFISTHWIKFDQMSMIHTRCHCSNEIIMIKRGLIWPNLDYLLLLHVLEYSLNYFDANCFISTR